MMYEVFDEQPVCILNGREFTLTDFVMLMTIIEILKLRTQS